MQNNIYQQAAETLASDAQLQAFATLNEMTVRAARQLLERLLGQPELAEEFRHYIFSSERSTDFQGYTAGESVGYQRGHQEVA